MVGVRRMKGDEGGMGGEGLGVPSSLSSISPSTSCSSSSLSLSRYLLAVPAPRCCWREALRGPPSSQCCRSIVIVMSRGFRVAVICRGSLPCFPGAGLVLGYGPPGFETVAAFIACCRVFSCASHARRRLRCPSSAVAAASAPLPLTATGAVPIVDGGAECPARGRWCHHPSEILAPAVSHEVRGASCSSLRCAGGKVPSFIDAPLVESAASVSQCCLLAAFPIGCCLDGALLPTADCSPAAHRLIRLSPVLTANLPPVLSRAPSNADRSATSPRLCPFP